MLLIDDRKLRNSPAQGFTLVELIGVLLLLSILSALAIPRYLDLEANASNRAIDAAIAELTGREGILWADVNFSASGFDPVTCDGFIWGNMKNDSTGNYPFLGAGYVWVTGPIETGGTLDFRGSDTVILSRTPSTTAYPAKWMRQP